MKLTLKQIIQASKDYRHKNEYDLKEYVIRDGKKHPFAVICPGGAYQMVCSFLEGEPYAKELNRLGYSAFVLYYRIKELAAYPAPQDDLARAIREILARAEELNLEMEGYSIWGSSAGGHLAASFGTENMGYKKYNLPKPAALILAYPVVTMAELSHSGSRETLIGKEPDPRLVAETSVEKQVTADYPPSFIWCGTADQDVPPDNSRMLKAALDERNISAELREYAGVEHGVGLGKGLACEGWIKEAIRFWDAQRKQNN